MGNPNIKSRQYLHPIRKDISHQFRTKDFRVVRTGQLADGTKLSQFSTNGNPSLHHNYRYGILSEDPSGATKVVFGKYGDIEQTAKSMKSNPEQVLKSLRPLDGGKSGAYFLGQSAPDGPMKSMPSKEAAESYAKARRAYPSGDSDTLQTRGEIEQGHLKSHFKEELERTNPHPYAGSDETVQAEINEKIDSVIGNGPSHAEPSALTGGDPE